jgi:large subunit ribosomal protein L22
MENIVTVTLREQRVSPKKARLVINLIRGMYVPNAIEATQFLNKKSAKLVNSLLKSALDAAIKKDFKPEELIVSESLCQEGKKLKRFTVKARGRSTQFHKRMSHLKISLAKADEVVKQPKKATEAITKSQRKNGSKS